MPHQQVGVLKEVGDILDRIALYKNEKGGYYVLKRKDKMQKIIHITSNTNYVMMDKTIYNIDFTITQDNNDTIAEWDPFFPR